ncbi:class I SAM-dependent methyltransferase [Planctomyces sp. SH-PL14]|uniref:class I SAM-dependent methyltransferase n=1 Tax=Planctomyces sp. SH-PL14 TaxID=1632864 RepID=UPI00078B8B50|nr:class I SAM-dependent methyltransferase [Planctomyces sp. SH-PL14]AMV16762.1 hypothetical protein VT03_02655 [Planctomyces sp. SH-PL14]
MSAQLEPRPETAYSAKFFDQLDGQTRASAEVIVPMVMDLLGPTSVVDVGCGRGVWLSVFREAGVHRVAGLDGAWVDPRQLAIPGECFQAVDLTADWPAPGTFDLAVSLEVGEHLAETASGRLVENLTRAASAVLFSAALPGQEGTHHINEQWPEFWEGLFAERGFARLDPFRRRIWQDPRVAWYYQQNLTLFVAQGVLDGSAALRQERDRAAICPLTLVHSKVLRPMKHPRPALHLLPRLVLEAIRQRWNRLIRGQ